MALHDPLPKTRPFVSPAKARAFIFAGNARVTLRSKLTGMRYTYRVRLDPRASAHSPVYFVDLLKGPDNGADYAYLGMVRQGRFCVTKATAHLGAAAYVRAFAHALRHLHDGNHIHSNLEIWHESRCGRCGRALTVPESVESGLGPECSRRAAA